MKTIILSAMLVAVLIGLSFYFLPWSKEYVKQTKDEINSGFANNISNEHLIDAGRQQISEASNIVEGQLTKIIEADAVYKDQLQDLAAKEQQLERKNQALSLAKDWLVSHKVGDSMQANGITYSYRDVESGARETLTSAQAIQEYIHVIKKSNLELSKSIEESRKAFDQNKAAIAKAESNINNKGVVMKAWEATSQVRQVTASLESSSINSRLINNPILAELNHRLNAMKSNDLMATGKMSVGADSEEQFLDSQSGETAKQIEVYLEGKSS